ncbi:hypothetical protein [Nocardia arizonensis]|uniref:hypothetical protein n=1 Tax=Nocardia arizonensis TaxID=1141647 RepID=UPI0006CF5118|nr:hypothetical protein [Nocardia arizonensis]
MNRQLRTAIAIDDRPAQVDEYAADRLVRIPARDRAAGTQIYFRGPDNEKLPLEYDMTFLLYWNPSGSGWFHPVGLWDNRDAGPHDDLTKDAILQWRIRPPRHVGDPAHTDSYMYFPLQTGLATWSWRTVTQRRGADYYLSVVPADTSNSWRTRGIRLAERYDDEIRFALYLDFADKINSWISDEHNTGSIRMENSLDHRASLVAVRYGTDPDDPFGPRTRFLKRGWDDLLG